MPRMPNRSEDLSPAGQRKRKERGTEVTRGTLRPLSEPLPPDPNWEPIAIELYESIFRSGQADWYQDSDVAFAWSVCDDLSYAKRSGKRSGQLLQTIYSALERLMVTEGDRRRLHLELQAAQVEEDDAEVVAMEDYRNRLAGGM